jgi:predicted Zn finger-like uncharacterized protein
MEVKIKCPWCGREYTVDSSIIGQTVKCISCDKQFKAESISSRSIPSYSNRPAWYILKTG